MTRRAALIAGALLIGLAVVALQRAMSSPPPKVAARARSAPPFVAEYEIRRVEYDADGIARKTREQHSFSGSWSSWRDSGPQALRFEAGTLTRGEPARDTTTVNATQYSPNDLFNVGHVAIGDGETIVHHNEDLAALRQRVAARLGLDASSLRAHTVLETGVCIQSQPACPTGGLRLRTTTVYDPTTRAPLYVVQQANGVTTGVMRVTRCDCR